MSDNQPVPWCAAHECPAADCGGPHTVWVNDNGDECLVPPGGKPPPGFRLPDESTPPG